MIVMNSLLEQIQNTKTKAVAYADDIMLFISDKSIDAIKARANAMLSLISTWGEVNGLSFNPNKTQCMLIRNKRKISWPMIEMNGKILSEQKSIKYLGLQIQNNLKWNEQIDKGKRKAKNMISQCSIAMKNDYGLPSRYRKRIYNSVIAPICTYGANVWKDAIKTQTNREKVMTIEQAAACKLIRCNRKANHNLVMYLSELTTIERLIEERSKNYETRKQPEEIRAQQKMQLKTERKNIRKTDFNNLPEFFTEMIGQHVEIKTEEWHRIETCNFLLRTSFFTQFKENLCPTCKEKERPTPRHIISNCKTWDRERQIYLETFDLEKP